MSTSLMTTGQAARLCAVKPDTVLKWIKKGRLRAVRTAGGHYRVDEGDVALLVSRDQGRDRQWEDRTALCSRPMRCWEYMNHGPGTECQECVVYQVRAAYCWRLANICRGAGHTKRFCTGVCQECPYYRRVHGLATNVLVITRDETLIQELARRANQTIDFRFARRGYDASAIISVFRPAFVIFDQAVLEDVGVSLMEALTSDPRTGGARIIVAVRKGAMGFRLTNGTVYATVEEPFHADEIAAVVERIPVESLEPKEAG